MYLIIDLEATCWEKSTEHQGENEIIEIGSVILNDKFEILGEVHTFVKPVRNPVLSDFCRELTSITQSQVDSAPLFPEALRSFQKQVEDLSGQKLSDLVLCSWGNYDREQLVQDCQHHKIAYPFGPHRSLKHEFAQRHRMRPMGMRRALRLSGIPFKGTKHRAFDDAWNLAQLFRLEWGGIKQERRTTRIQFWIAVAVGFAVTFICGVLTVPEAFNPGAFLGALIAGAIANGARRGGSAAFLAVLLWGIASLFVIPSVGVSMIFISDELGILTSVASIFALSIFGLLFGLLGGLLGRLIRYLSRSFPIGQDKEISYVLPNACYVKLSVHNLLGRRIKTLVDGYKPAGHKSVKWDGTDEEGNKVVSGIYFYRIQAGGIAETKKMVMLK